MLANVEPSCATAIAILVVCLALVFTSSATTGFHDIANAVATFSAIICVFGVRLFHFGAQIPMPVLKFSGWSLL